MSDGETEQEALDNVRDAIGAWIAAAEKWAANSAPYIAPRTSTRVAASRHGQNLPNQFPKDTQRRSKAQMGDFSEWRTTLPAMRNGTPAKGRWGTTCCWQPVGPPDPSWKRAGGSAASPTCRIAVSHWRRVWPGCGSTSRLSGHRTWGKRRAGGNGRRLLRPLLMRSDASTRLLVRGSF